MKGVHCVRVGLGGKAVKAGVSPEAENSQEMKEKSVGKKREIKEEEREKSRVKAERVILPALLTLGDKDYEKQWEAKKAQTYAQRTYTMPMGGHVFTAVQKNKITWGIN